MSNKRSALKPSECENVTCKLKKGKILNLGLYQRRKTSALHHTTQSVWGSYSQAYKNLWTGLQTIKVNAQNLIFFVSLNVVWLFYITCS